MLHARVGGKKARVTKSQKNCFELLQRHNFRNNCRPHLKIPEAEKIGFGVCQRSFNSNNDSLYTFMKDQNSVTCHIYIPLPLYFRHTISAIT